MRPERSAAAIVCDQVLTRVLDGFDDPTFGTEQWEELVRRTPTRHVFLTWQWLSTWWAAFPRERLLLVVAERDSEPVALAPFFADDEGLIYFVGSGGSDYLDFIGDLTDAEVLHALLDTARSSIAAFKGFRLYHIVDRSLTGPQLWHCAERLGLICRDEGALPAPALDFTASPDAAQSAIKKRSLVRHENGFAREAEIHVEHLCDGEAILPQLDEFFDQHIERWASTPHPSAFRNASRRTFYRRLTSCAASAGWLRFTRIRWRDRSIAFHFGFCYDGTYLWYKPSFAIDLAKRSPGEVLLRQLIVAALDQRATTFDFGMGDERFKYRFANRVEQVRTWSLLPT